MYQRDRRERERDRERLGAGGSGQGQRQTYTETQRDSYIEKSRKKRKKHNCKQMEKSRGQQKKKKEAGHQTRMKGRRSPGQGFPFFLVLDTQGWSMHPSKDTYAVLPLSPTRSTELAFLVSPFSSNNCSHREISPLCFFLPPSCFYFLSKARLSGSGAFTFYGLTHFTGWKNQDPVCQQV